MAANQLLQPAEYLTDHTRLGTWRRFMYPSGAMFSEFRSHGELFGLPLIHYTAGPSPETGRRKTARGVLAVGRRAVGIIAIGQASAGVVALGQASAGLLLGLGQASVGYLAVGQLALGWELGLGQFATGAQCVAQFGLGEWVLAQFGAGTHVCDTRACAPEAARHFQEIWAALRAFLFDAA